jgi:hypothetical protein
VQTSSASLGGHLKQERPKIESTAARKKVYKIFFLINKVLIDIKKIGLTTIEANCLQILCTSRTSPTFFLPFTLIQLKRPHKAFMRLERVEEMNKVQIQGRENFYGANR